MSFFYIICHASMSRRLVQQNYNWLFENHINAKKTANGIFHERGIHLKFLSKYEKILFQLKVIFRRNSIRKSVSSRITKKVIQPTCLITLRRSKIHWNSIWILKKETFQRNAKGEKNSCFPRKQHRFFSTEFDYLIMQKYLVCQKKILSCNA